MLTITCNRSTNQESPRASKGHTMSIMSDTTTDSQSTPIYLLLTLKLFRPSDNYRLVGLFCWVCRQQQEEERLSKSKKYVFISASFLGKLRFHSLTSVFPRTTFTPPPEMLYPPGFTTTQPCHPQHSIYLSSVGIPFSMSICETFISNLFLDRNVHLILTFPTILCLPLFQNKIS